MAKKKCEVLVLNNVAHVGLKRFPADTYSVVKDSKDPWAILVRSADLHKHEFGPSLRAVGRAGAGVNNIPVAALSKRGIPVFNAPGANANAVKELVLAGMLIAARNLAPALEFTVSASGSMPLRLPRPSCCGSSRPRSTPATNRRCSNSLRLRRRGLPTAAAR